jgi:hypothetical protein
MSYLCSRCCDSECSARSAAAINAYVIPVVPSSKLSSPPLDPPDSDETSLSFLACGGWMADESEPSSLLACARVWWNRLNLEFVCQVLRIRLGGSYRKLDCICKWFRTSSISTHFALKWVQTAEILNPCFAASGTKIWRSRWDIFDFLISPERWDSGESNKLYSECLRWILVPKITQRTQRSWKQNRSNKRMMVKMAKFVLRT